MVIFYTHTKNLCINMYPHMISSYYVFYQYNDDDVYLGYYSGKMVSYKLPCLYVLRKTHKHSRYGISSVYYSPKQNIHTYKQTSLFMSSNVYVYKWGIDLYLTYTCIYI
jgi:hypothetical protein